jgi:hypothetical protein
MLTALGDGVTVQEETTAFIPLARRAGLGMLTRYQEMMVMVFHPGPGQAAKMRQTLVELLPVLKDNRRVIAGVHLEVGRLAMQEGDFVAAEADARAALAIAHSQVMECAALGGLARSLVALGRVDEALGCARQARSLLEVVRCIVTTNFEAAVRLALPEALMASGERDAAIAAIAEAKQWLLGLAARITTPELRNSFLERVPENARIVELSATWVQ